MQRSVTRSAVFMFLAFVAGPGIAAASPVTAEDYERAEKWFVAWESGDNPYVKNPLPVPHWIGESDEFWYLHETGDGRELLIVDAATGKKRPAFDHRAVAAALRRTDVEKAVAVRVTPWTNHM